MLIFQFKSPPKQFRKLWVILIAILEHVELSETGSGQPQDAWKRATVIRIVVGKHYRMASPAHLIRISQPINQRAIHRPNINHYKSSVWQVNHRTVTYTGINKIN